jgi:hypothetical protein
MKPETKQLLVEILTAHIAITKEQAKAMPDNSDYKAILNKYKSALEDLEKEK